jgi:predicted DNA-binding protein (MmcQ/YjbR family)
MVLVSDVTPHDMLRHGLTLPGAWEDEPWEGSVVLKVGSRIFAFFGSGEAIGVKCGRSREEADEWLVRYPDDAGVMPYVGRSGWNSLTIGGAIPADELMAAIDSSYDLVVSKLPKKDRPT